jgi:hypothetical protein
MVEVSDKATLVLPPIGVTYPTNLSEPVDVGGSTVAKELDVFNLEPL